MNIKEIITKIFPAQVKFYQNIKILKDEFGQYRSIRKSVPVNKTGDAIPWYTYPSIEFLSQFDFSGKRILEFGSGYSTVFWANRCKKITSVEHERSWLEIVKSFVSEENTELMFFDAIDYTQICRTSTTKFDVIIIDGIKRAECAKEIKNCLNTESGIVILDNSDRYPETSDFLRNELNLFEIDFFGFGPINNYTWCTSVFVSRDTRLEPLKKQPYDGIASLIQNCENA